MENAKTYKQMTGTELRYYRNHCGTYETEIKEYDELYGKRNITKTPLVVIHFIDKINGKLVEAIRTGVKNADIYINGQCVGPYQNNSTLTNIFDELTKIKINQTIQSALFNIKAKEDIKVYVANPFRDDPKVKAAFEKLQKYWKSIQVPFEKLMDDMTTKTAGYKTEEIEHNGLPAIKHIKARVSNIMVKRCNIDLSYIITNLDNNLIQEETYQETIFKVDKEGIAWWYVNNGFTFEQMNMPTTDKFNK